MRHLFQLLDAHFSFLMILIITKIPTRFMARMRITPRILLCIAWKSGLICQIQSLILVHQNLPGSSSRFDRVKPPRQSPEIVLVVSAGICQQLVSLPKGHVPRRAHYQQIVALLDGEGLAFPVTDLWRYLGDE